DLPIAVGVLAAQDLVPQPALEGILMMGELSLDGSLRRVAGGLPIALYARAGDTDLADVRGLEYVKLALEVAAAGSHNLLLIGAPGSGKSMIARRLPSILPPLDEDEALQTSMIYSAAGKLDGASLIRQRPFRAPHQDVSL